LYCTILTFLAVLPEDDPNDDLIVAKMNWR
jgi:hypothetical protein